MWSAEPLCKPLCEVAHETITKKPLCLASLHILINITALDLNCFVKASLAQPHTRDYWIIA